MKTNKILKSARLYVLSTLICSVFACCQDEQITESSKTIPISTRAVPTQSFDWENADWMPTPPNQSTIPSPWIGQGSLASTYGIDIINDRKASDGWELMYSSFNSTASGPLVNPYFILYNKYRGTMRIFLYLTTQFVSTSSYLQDGISIISNQKTSMFNFLGQDIIDINVNKSQYSQMQPAPSDGSLPLASNKWYMMQYEIAYDPNITEIPYNNIQLSWSMNYYDVGTINLGGTATGKLNGVIGSSSSTNIFSSLLNLGEVAGTGVLAGIGKDFLTKNTIDEKTGENKLGLPNSVFKSVLSGVSSALSTAVGKLPDAGIKILSALIGGGSTTTPISFNVNIDINLKGTETKGGSFPSSPTSFWVPGTNIASNAAGYIPLYNKSLGVINFSNNPTSIPPTLCFSFDEKIYEERSEPMEPERIWFVTKYHLIYPRTIEHPEFLIINPEVLKIAKVTIERQELLAIETIIVNNEKIKKITVNPADEDWEQGGEHDTLCPLDKKKYAIRYTIKVQPLNGTPSSIIIKTLSVNAVLRLN